MPRSACVQLGMEHEDQVDVFLEQVCRLCAPLRTC
jgi:hypothetical protein